MAVYTKHPVSAPPAAPVREKTGHLLLRAWCVFVLFLAVTGAAWVDAVGATIASLIAVAAGAVSIGLWFAVRPYIEWRRLPVFPIAYVLWAGLCLIWSTSLAASAVSWVLLVVTMVQAVFVASVLTWRELVRAVSSALKWAIGLSLVFELAVAIFVQEPLMPGFIAPSRTGQAWSEGALFTGGRIQGIFGDSNLLAVMALIAIVVFAIRIANGAPRVELGIWIALSAFLLVRAQSGTAYVAAAAVAVVLITVLLMRRAKRPGERTGYYIGFVVVALAGAAAVWIWHDAIFTAFERASDNVWVDVSSRFGVTGAILLTLSYLVFVWRAWFFAVDRPRWDLRADRPYSSLTLLPTLLGVVLLVQGIAQSGALLLWGWMFLVMFAFKVIQAPHIGFGPAEQSIAIERGELHPSG
ncbi:O-antigen ligase family protein [Microbacterium rhizomatis]|uniref:O-antigen ligase family protein n=1 Tax=Microbacterium rhizomatis TaxID=1631477 RepID=A0A5J5J8V7_9MICO|nr:O-antigen ligase family protein [Microbacterium rhizomatis]KAA9111218.1 O-antigen ligase family protein [Microbacterium rhizomatis]